MALTHKFWDRVKRCTPTCPMPCNHCWLWVGRRYKRKNANYGAFDFAGRCYRAHRFSYELHCGAIPPGKSVLHKCDNPPCVNPSHLYVGTQLDNVRDCVARGRTYDRHGAKNSNCVLTNAAVAKLKILAQHGLTQRYLAKMFGVSKSQVGNVLRGEQRAK